MLSGAIESTIGITESMVIGYNKNKEGNQVLEIDFEGTTYSYTVNIKDNLIGISLQSSLDKTDYKYDEKLDLTGGKLIITKDSGIEVINITEEMVSGYNPKKSGTQVIKVTYEGKTVEIIVNVANKTSQNQEETENTGGTGNGSGTNTNKPSGGTGSGSGTNTNNTSNGTDTNNASGEENINVEVQTPEPEDKSDIPGTNTKPDENTKHEDAPRDDKFIQGILGPIKETLGGLKENIVPISALSILLGGLSLLLLLIKRRDNVEIYDKVNGEYRLIGKDRISKKRPNVVLDGYKKNTINIDMEVILKKSISKKLDKKQVIVTMGKKSKNYKVNYKNEDYQIFFNNR